MADSSQLQMTIDNGQTQIRIATEADAATLAGMFERFNAGYQVITIAPEQMAARLQACAGIETTLLAEAKGQAAGFVCVRALGAAEIVVLTGHENNRAQALYRRAGYGDYAVALRKQL